MSKNKGNRNSYNYNRQSKGYQKNLYRQKMNAEGIKPPKTPDAKKLRIAVIAIAVVWVIASVLLTLNFRWIGLLIGLLIGVACAAGIYFYLRNVQNKTIKYYKQLGLTEAQYLGELRRRKVSDRQIEAYRKIWRKTKVD